MDNVTSRLYLYHSQLAKGGNHCAEFVVEIERDCKERQLCWGDCYFMLLFAF